MKNLGRSLWLIICVLIVSCSPIQAENNGVGSGVQIKSYQECVDAGNKVLRTYPGRCVTAEGQIFIEPIEKPGKKLCKDSCGNGQCEEIVCMGEGCPCSETHDSCPSDCRP